MVFDSWCTEPYITSWICTIWWATPKKKSKWWTCVLGWQFLLTPWVLSTWLGGLTGQSIPESKMTAQSSSETPANHCSSVSLCVTSGHALSYGWMGHGCRHMISITHNLLKSDKHMVLLTTMVLGLLDRRVLRILILQAKTNFMGVATYWVLSVNLNLGRMFKEMNETYEQANCPTSWD